MQNTELQIENDAGTSLVSFLTSAIDGCQINIISNLISKHVAVLCLTIPASVYFYLNLLQLTTQLETMSDKPRVLILGGVGFVGRNLVKHLVQNNLVSKIAVADKVLPDTAGLSAEELKLYKDENGIVVYKQANLAREGKLRRYYQELIWRIKLPKINFFIF